jgi:glycosyltransferase involved in cell wall biosynthesis
MTSYWRGPRWSDKQAVDTPLAALLAGRRQACGADPAPDAHVCILLAVLDGAATLPEQLDSLAAQTHRNWQILASDDGSRDDSAAILKGFARHHPLVRMAGPGRGCAANFLSLIRRMGPHATEDSWLAFCDQDDVWLPERLSRGIAALSEGPADQPALYCSRTWITDGALRRRRLSAPRRRAPSFANALVQNIAGGNTILLNPAATRLVRSAARKVDAVVVHDWWVYQLVTGAGGRVIHDETPTVLYRQHGRNQIGANDTWSARVRRARMILKGIYRDWNDANIRALATTEQYLSPESRAMLTRFARLRRAGPLQRLRDIRQLGLYRHGPGGTLALWVSVLMGRL